MEKQFLLFYKKNIQAYIFSPLTYRNKNALFQSKVEFIYPGFLMETNNIFHFLKRQYFFYQYSSDHAKHEWLVYNHVTYTIDPTSTFCS